MRYAKYVEDLKLETREAILDALDVVMNERPYDVEMVFREVLRPERIKATVIQIRNLNPVLRKAK